MVVSLNWLKEYVDIDENLTIQEIVDRLTMSGSKVETFETFGIKTKEVVTGIVEKIEPHESNDKLKVLTIDIRFRKLTAVAKIPDIEVGDIIPVALPGARVINKEVNISAVEGVKSECMVCHILDLGLDAKKMPWVKPSGLLVFPKDVKIGEDINDILGLGDYLIEFEITPNRPDCLSIEGIAKELAVTFGKDCKELWQYKEPDFMFSDSINGISVSVESENCKRYTMNVAENIKVENSPYDLQIKLIKCGIRPINNIVDLTNYVMLEIGQPLHAFDKDKINSDKIVVRQAKDGETLETLDGINRILDKSSLAITNGKNPIAIAGIMGGELSGIDENTKSVVLEAANFVRGNIRNTSKKQVLRTDASSRYEKGLPSELTIHAMSRIVDLINSTNCGIIVNNIVDIYPQKQVNNTIEINYDKINSVIGTNISVEDIDKILEDLGIEIKDNIAFIPYFREDLELVEDLAEEVARIYGYDKLPSTLPNTSLTFGAKTKEQKIEEKLKEIANASGYNEIYTYTFFSKETLERMCLNKKSSLFDLVRVKNPLSKDFEYMRTTTMPLMLEALERNFTRKNTNVKLFEFGKIFEDAENVLKDKLVTENYALTFGMYDDYSNFYDIKEVVEKVLNYYNILDNNYIIERIENKDEYHPGMSARIVIGEDIIAEFGKLSPIVQKNYILPENTYMASIYFDKILKYENKELKFVELPKYPAVERDLAFVISKDVLSFEIIKLIKTVDTVESVELFDVYEGKQIEEGKKSMAYRILLRSNEKTLGDEEIVNTMNKIVELLKSKFNIEIRS